ncbi:Transcription factor fungi [Macrophomina phaseolina MS6]|uniref:Transcription factor fungi n=1 Tax=Macrophomina phaseolina (strain MS6) TaxID=1126212 RepID=K2QNC0_MACPH|nr:Transcription factor fungi [Macrophomina phaseolina MS6]
MSMDASFHSPLAALSFAAEQSAFQDALAASSPHAFGATPAMAADNFQHITHADSLPQSTTIGGSAPPADPDFAETLDSLAAFLENEPLSSYHFSSTITAEQPVPFFSPESILNSTELDGHHINSAFGHGHNLEEPNSFSRFGSRLPSLQPEEQSNGNGHRPTTARPVSDISNDDRQTILEHIAEFSSAIPRDFRLPSRLALSRYIGAYINGFHEHLPFLHIPTMTVENTAVELLLALAAVGAQYCFEAEKGVELFHTARAIASQRIRRRDATLARSNRDAQTPFGGAVFLAGQSPPQSHHESSRSSSMNGQFGLPTDSEQSAGQDSLIQTAQAFLTLMAMATWAKHKEILREALGIQSILATLVREDGLCSQPIPSDITWEEWAAQESRTRTKFIVFCFFNLHCIVYNIPPLILNSELKMRLPANASEFKATSAAKWHEARKRTLSSSPSPTAINFQDALRRLFSRGGRDITELNTSLGNYILIHALIQHIFFVRQTARCRFGDPPASSSSPSAAGELTAEDVSSLEHALRNWQLGWKRNPESSLDPMDPNGPVAFNSTALLRLAYIRLNMDTGPGRALDTRDPVAVATALRDTPTIKRTPKLVRAVLHSAHALSIPVKIGIRLVARTQTFIWSIQHSLCSLECAFLLSKWLEALSAPAPEPPVSEDEKRIVGLVKTMLDETEFAVPASLENALDSGGLPELARRLNAGVLRVWATIFRGAQTWALVDVIGSSLNIYADMLEPG